MNGFLLLDKEKDWTSFDVVKKVKGITGERKIGHSGTLDPLATGLLVLALGQGTKLLEYLIGCDKAYEVVARFGSVSDTFDAAGEVTLVSDGEVCPADLQKAVEGFVGEIEQVPPKYSALKIAGRRACDLVREGKEVEMKSRSVRIERFEILEFAWPEVSFSVKCSTGTYIRSLIHDLGAKLEVGAYVKELRRTRVGKFFSMHSCKVEELNNNVEQRLISMEEMARSFPFIELNDEEWQGLQNGHTVESNKVEQGELKMAFYKGEMVGVLKAGMKFEKKIL
ncbi:tRNA pseudouridine(55) synthase TruB [Candidatus Gracilibacteria bacterium]|nr:tRNA pseudouridine(55) synthase TruB [Candidatus Gracilibacteria bacterium]